MKNREVSYTVQWNRIAGEFLSNSSGHLSKVSALRRIKDLTLRDARIVKTTITREVVWKSKTLKKKRKAA